jgi:cytoskeletal protein CcmA (bactofilin family)
VSLFGGKRDDGETPEPTATPPAPTSPAAKALQAPQPAQHSSDRPRGNDVATIGKSITIHGDLTGNEDIVIEGKVEGKVSLPNNSLTIGAHGQVKAEINAKTVIVVGHVVGNVQGTERVEIQASGQMDGDVSSPKLVVAEGAQLNGAVAMTSGAGAAGKPQLPAKPEPTNREARKAG